MSPTMHRTNSDELTQRRFELISQSGMTEEQFREGAADYTLSADEALTWDEIRQIDFLLGG